MASPMQNHKIVDEAVSLSFRSEHVHGTNKRRCGDEGYNPLLLHRHNFKYALTPSLIPFSKEKAPVDWPISVSLAKYIHTRFTRIYFAGNRLMGQSRHLGIHKVMWMIRSVKCLDEVNLQSISGETMRMIIDGDSRPVYITITIKRKQRALLYISLSYG